MISQAEQFDLEAQLAAARREIAKIRTAAMLLLWREQQLEGKWRQSGAWQALQNAEAVSTENQKISLVATLAQEAIHTLLSAGETLRGISCATEPDPS